MKARRGTSKRESVLLSRFRVHALSKRDLRRMVEFFQMRVRKEAFMRRLIRHRAQRHGFWLGVLVTVMFYMSCDFVGPALAAIPMLIASWKMHG